MQGISDTHYDFALRLKRIEASAQARTQRLFVGEDESYVVPRRERKVERSRLAVMFGNAAYPLSMGMAVALGFGAQGLGMVIRFWVEGLRDWNANPDIEMVKELVLAYALAMVLGYLLGLRSTTLTSLKVLGAALGVLFFHNLVHLYPAIFAKLTSQLWVSQMMAHTKAHAMMWRGISFAF
ncbi:hypothetical protein GC209_15110 [bacterium]|nr:hypothetical protein [bacterium]